MSYPQSADPSPMTVGDWLITRLVLAIPIVNLIMYLVWALSSSGNVNRKNYCIAGIIWWLIWGALGAIGLLLFAVLAAVVSSHSGMPHFRY